MIKKRITSPRLLKEREKLILALYRRGFFIEEIADIFRLQKSRVGQIVKVEANPRSELETKQQN